MTLVSSLTRIEFRRSLGIWLSVPLLVITLWAASDYLSFSIRVWSDTSIALRNSTVLLGPVAAALAAWMAGRDRRTGLEELLATLPESVGPRVLAAWAGTAGWGILVYLVAVLMVGGVTAVSAAWGWPSFSLILVGLASVTAHSAIGFAAGYWFPWRLTAPIVGIALFVFRGLVAFNPTAIEYLSPVPGAETPIEVYYEPNLSILLGQIIWLIGVTGLALAIAVLTLSRTPREWVATGVTFLIAAGSCAFLIISASQPLRGAEASYNPVCTENTITVCLHPAYEPMLTDAAGVVDRIIRPIAGAPGAPSRAEQRATEDALDGWDGDTLLFELNSIARDEREFASAGYDQFADVLARRLAGLTHWSGPDDTTPETRLQQVIANWLLTQAGIPLSEQVGEHDVRIRGFVLDPDQEAALERFARLDQDRQRDWLTGNYLPMRSGELSLEDLP